jgi:hypothetical protein
MAVQTFPKQTPRTGALTQRRAADTTDSSALFELGDRVGQDLATGPLTVTAGTWEEAGGGELDESWHDSSEAEDSGEGE